MGLRTFVFGLTIVFGCVTAQNTGRFRVCMSPSNDALCQIIQMGDRVVCEVAKTKVDCALKLARGEADLGAFTEEELMLLSQLQPEAHRVIGNIRHVSRREEFAFETVAVVSVDHTGGLEGLRGGGLCHPGFDNRDQRWSPRVLRQLEERVARTDSCNESDLPDRTFEELEVRTISQFFGGACRPGPWSHNVTIDERLKQDFPNLCHLCNAEGDSTSCDYTFDMGVRVSGIDNDNRHIQALECLVRHHGNVSYVAWQHVREYFLHRSIGDISRFGLLCEDGRVEPLTEAALDSPTAICSWVRQPWGGLVASNNQTISLLAETQNWWPNGLPSSNGTWQSSLFQVLIGQDFQINFLQDIPTVQRYVSGARNISSIDSITTCQPLARWCTINTEEHTKCVWIRQAAYTLGIQPYISCQQRQNVFQCLDDIRNGRADFISLDSNYGYLARVGYSLSSVKLLQNSHADSSRIVALVRQASVAADEITRFENLRGTRACFPEFGGIAYMAFVRVAHERGVISERECDYARAVGEFFSGACAPGALEPTHNINPGTDSDFNINVLCDVCRNVIDTPGTFPDDTCAADTSNLFYGTNGTIMCLNDPENQVAFIETQNLQQYISDLGLNAANFRALCQNNTVALTPGITLDDNCLLALVVNEEVLTRRNDQHFNSLTSLLELLENYFGFTAAFEGQLINLQIFSPFDNINNLLFLDSALGFTAPSVDSSHVPARNYIELFSHLEACTDGSPGLANQKTLFSVFAVIIMNVMIRYIL